jgi:hypothetical protein
MRSDIEIRREVETRLRRRGLLVLNGGLGALVVLFLYQYTTYRSLGEPLATLVILFMLGWFFLGVIHATAVLYIEMRDRLVRSAIERERQFYLLRDHYEKQKRSREDAARLRRLDDGELVDYPDERKVKVDYER